MGGSILRFQFVLVKFLWGKESELLIEDLMNSRCVRGLKGLSLKVTVYIVKMNKKKMSAFLRSI